jgi:TolB-like protein/DNA-binding winged helix-turn-helix (wHTH) protein
MDKAAPARIGEIEGISRTKVFRLGSVEVFPESGMIRGSGGTRQLDPKVMDVLLRLVRAGGEVVSREELMATVWPGTVVTDFALSRCIYQLRKNLRRVADSPDSPIDTLPKRGYRLAWDVSGINAAESEYESAPTGNRRLGLGIAAALLLGAVAALGWWHRNIPVPPADRLAVAVLPFADLTQARDLGYFGDGVATSLMTELGQITEIDVIARTSSFYFRDRSAEVGQIAEALDVDFLVEGSVNSEDEAVQVTAALVDVSSGRHVWSGTFEGVAGQSFTAQQDIANAIGGYLEISLGDPRSHGGTTVFEAWDAYLKAFDVNTVNDDGSGDFFLDQALAYDPDFALALEAKAFYIYLRLWQGDGIVEDAWDEARPLLERAVEINDHSAFAYGTMAGFQIFREEFESAEALLTRALEINPSDTWALVHLSRLMEQTGRLEDAIRLAQHNARLDPLNSFRHLQLANRLWTAGHFEEASASFERSIELDPLNYASWRDYCLRLANRDGELAGFRLLARLQENPEFRAQFIGPEPQLAPTGIGLIALWLGFIGDFDRKLELLELQSRIGDSAELHRELAWSHLARGETGLAREEAWLALRGMPRNDITNRLVTTIALRTGQGLESVREHQESYWPQLFDMPPSAGDTEGLVVISVALVARALGHETQANALLGNLAARDSASPGLRAMALAHQGDHAEAVALLKQHVESGGFFGYEPGNDPFWEPLAGEAGFTALVEAEAAKDAQVRDQVALMIDRGELLLPGGR